MTPPSAPRRVSLVLLFFAGLAVACLFGVCLLGLATLFVSGNPWRLMKPAATTQAAAIQFCPG